MPGAGCGVGIVAGCRGVVHNTVGYCYKLHGLTGDAL